MERMTNSTNALLRSAFPRARRATHISTPESLPRGLFVAELLRLGLPHIGQDEFRGRAPAAKLAVHGRPVLVRADPSDEVVEAFLRLETGELVLVDAGYGHVCVEVAARTRAAADAIAKALRTALAITRPAPTRVSVAFWMRGRNGGHVRHREIEAPSFTEVEDNYTAVVRAALQRLLAVRGPERGRLILWRGEPGTGKSHALRALAREWAPWCSTHFILDPRELFGHGGTYLLDVLTWDGDRDGEDRWRLVVLEDAGELIAADARVAAGQALSSLLNVADGLLGQGTRTLVLITTNEPVRRLHPATRRPGRCLCDIEFAPLSVDEANAWLAARGHERRVTRPTPLAELFAQDGGVLATDDGDRRLATSFGFARSLPQ